MRISQAHLLLIRSIVLVNQSPEPAPGTASLAWSRPRTRRTDGPRACAAMTRAHSIMISGGLSSQASIASRSACSGRMAACRARIRIACSARTPTSEGREAGRLGRYQCSPAGGAGGGSSSSSGSPTVCLPARAELAGPATRRDAATVLRHVRLQPSRQACHALRPTIPSGPLSSLDVRYRRASARRILDRRSSSGPRDCVKQSTRASTRREYLHAVQPV